jgi:hypothetical protein
MRSDVPSFLRRAAAFAALLALINAIVWLLDERPRDRAYRRPAGEGPVLLLGDSHAAALGAGPGVRNWAAPQDAYPDMARKLAWALRHDPPAAVWLAADDHALGPYRERHDNAHRSLRLIPAAGWSAFRDGRLYHVLPLLRPDLGQRWRWALAARFGWLPWASPRAAGWPAWEGLTAEDRALLCRERGATQYAVPDTSAVLAAVLDGIVADCRRAGVPLLGLRLPVAPEYRAWKDSAGAGYGAAARLRAAGVPLLDGDTAFAGNPAYFRDPDHLSARGVAAFWALAGERAPRLTRP